jgi:hypothetical protein
MQLIVLQNFHVFVETGKNTDGSDRPPNKIKFFKGQTLGDNEIPAGQHVDGDDGWIAHGLVREAASGDRTE